MFLSLTIVDEMKAGSIVITAHDIFTEYLSYKEEKKHSVANENLSFKEEKKHSVANENRLKFYEKIKTYEDDHQEKARFAGVKFFVCVDFVRQRN